jgi:cytochrome c oxidase assembly factor CtaG
MIDHLAEFLPPVFACLVYLALYRRRLGTLARRGTGVARWRTWCFGCGVLLTTLVQLPPLDGLADDVLAAHMVQHIVIGDLCSLLVVLGLTGPVLAPVLRVRALRPLRALGHPLVALTLWAIDLYAWHMPFMYQLAIRHDLVHALEHACMLWFGTMLWVALLGPLPKPAWFGGWARILYVLGVRLAGAVLATALIWGQSVFYPIYRASDAGRGISALTDQSIAGGIMFVEQVILTTIVLGWLFVRYLREDGERQQLVDLARERRVALSDERAARAVAAGRSDRLRQRLVGR